MTGVFERRIRRDVGKRTDKLTTAGTSERKRQVRSLCIKNARDATKYRARERPEQARLAGGPERLQQAAADRLRPDIMVPM